MRSFPVSQHITSAGWAGGTCHYTHAIRLTVNIDKPVFGQYACAGPSGAVLRVGDEVEVTERISRNNTPSQSPITPATSNGPITPT